MNFKSLINDFIDNEIYDLQEEGNNCLEMCEEEGNYHLTSYWINGTYYNINYFIENNYSDDLYKAIVEMYPYPLDALIEKIKNVYDKFTAKTIAYEALASILLKEMQHYSTWYTVYGSEETDMIDFKKYNIFSALSNQDEFPIIKREDIISSMYGINDTIHPSDMYDIFAHYSDNLKFKDKNSFLDIDNEAIFTPYVFLVASLVARYKNYIDMAKNKNSDYAVKFFEMSGYEQPIKELFLLAYAIDDYLNRFNNPPYSLPLHKDMINASIIDVNGVNKYRIKYKIRGIENKQSCWDNIAEIIYEIPKTIEEFQSFIIQIAIDFKRELSGLEKVKNKDIKAILGKYPNKYSTSHGLIFAKDINVNKKDARGKDFKKPMKCNYSLALAEKQSLYLIKKSLRYANLNPVLSCSFGVDSITTLHLLRRVNKHDYNIVFNNSLVEYPELTQYKNRLCSEWGLSDKLIETKPMETYWDITSRIGWNIERKGDRRNGRSTSEECCNKIKHIPMYNQISKFAQEGRPMQVNFTGLRANESRAREQAVKRDNVVYFSKTWKAIKVNPIGFYSEEMVWKYVNKHNVPYCEVYDKVLYYEDVYDNIHEDEYHKVYYKPRMGCWTCLLNKSRGYLHWLKKFYPRHYNYLMINKGLAKDLFIPGAKKLGIISENIIVKSNQLSLFDYNNENFSVNNLSTKEILKRYSLEDMESLIMRRPCKFLA